MDCGSKHLVTMATTLLATASFVSTATADEVLLRGGGRVNGVIVERTSTTVVIETGPGRVTLSMSRVEKIVDGSSFLAEYRERAARLEPGDAVGWAALAHWASDRDLLTLAADAWRHVLELDPAHPEANAALGRVAVGGTWMSAEEGNRARGLIPFEGRWVTPGEHESILRERAFEDAAAREEREGDLRVREAEARAREAEARAREAEVSAAQAEAEASTDPGAIPLWWGVGGGGAVVSPYGAPPGHDGFRSRDGFRSHEGRSGSRERSGQPTPQPKATPTPPPPSLRPTGSSRTQKTSAPLVPASRPERQER
jgi:hypothetical protein